MPHKKSSSRKTARKTTRRVGTPKMAASSPSLQVGSIRLGRNSKTARYIVVLRLKAGTTTVKVRAWRKLGKKSKKSRK